MHICALYKTFSGDEFVEASIESIYSCVDKIVFSHSDVNWLGEKGINTVYPVVKKWQKENDKKNKIIHLWNNIPSQKEQCDSAYTWIKNVFNPVWIMSIDTDEVFSICDINKLLKLSFDCHMFNAIHIKMYTYLKSPYYRVTNIEACKPCILFRPIFERMYSTRGNGVNPLLIPEDIYMHHFTYVRSKEKDVFRKIWTSDAGDKDDNPNVQLVNMDNWIKHKWMKIETAKNLHTTLGYEWSWESVKKIKINDLPETLRNKKILLEYNK